MSTPSLCLLCAAAAADVAATPCGHVVFCLACSGLAARCAPPPAFAPASCPACRVPAVLVRLFPAGFPCSGGFSAAAASSSSCSASASPSARAPVAAPAAAPAAAPDLLALVSAGLETRLRLELARELVDAELARLGASRAPDAEEFRATLRAVADLVTLVAPPPVPAPAPAPRRPAAVAPLGAPVKRRRADSGTVFDRLIETEMARVERRRVEGRGRGTSRDPVTFEEACLAAATTARWEEEDAARTAAEEAAESPAPSPAEKDDDKWQELPKDL